MKKDELLSCPFCGEQPDIHTNHVLRGKVACMNTDCPINSFDIKIKDWNRRVKINKISKNLKTDPLKLKKNDILIGEKE